MTVPLAFTLLANLLALAFTLSVMLISVLWQHWRTRTGRALFQFLLCLTLLQSGTLLTHLSLLAELSDGLVQAFVNLAVLGFYLVILASLVLLLSAARVMKDLWALVTRSGVAGLFILQPAVWQHHVFELPSPLDHDLFGSSFTPLGRLLALISAAFIFLTFFAGWYYWRRINVPLVIISIETLAAAQLVSLMYNPLREFPLTGVMGGVISGALGFYLILHFDLTPQSPQLSWLKSISSSGIDLSDRLPLVEVLANNAEQIRRLLHADSVSVLLAIGLDRLQVKAVAGRPDAILGRQIRVGEGLAGRVMQTRQPLRVDNYRAWSGRSADFADLPYHASISVPLVYGDHLVGVVNVHETAPGRVFNDQDQAVLEMLTPPLTLTIIRAQLEHDLSAMHIYFNTVMAFHHTAMMIFDSSGTLREANPVARNYLNRLFGTTKTSLTMIELGARAGDTGLMDVLAHWMAAPAHYSVQTQYDELGELAVQLHTILDRRSDTPSLLVIMRPASD